MIIKTGFYKLIGCKCDLCGHEWIPRIDPSNIRQCPNLRCRTMYWNENNNIIDDNIEEEDATEEDMEFLKKCKRCK